MNLDLESLNAQQSATAGMYRLLSTLWCSEVSESLLAELRSGSCGQTFAEHQFFTADEVIDGNILAADYCQLLVGPRDHLPPYQSVWEEGQLAGRAAASMRRYGEILQRPLLRREIEADHLGYQLAMMGTITAGISAVPCKRESLVSYDALGHDFFAAHLCWPAPLLARAEQQAQTNFYRALSRCTRKFLEMEAAFWS